MNINQDTFKTVNDLADLKMNGFLIDLCGEIALIRRNMKAYDDQNKSYVIAHYSKTSNSFYWSSYDLTLAEAVNMFYRETLADEDYKRTMTQAQEA